jgi:thiol-disulfide isomerase/thioredoxin
MKKILSTTTTRLLVGFLATSFGRAILATMLVCFSFGTSSAQLNSHPTLAIGSAAPDFSLQGVDGKIYTLQSFAKSKFLVVIFTCDHCPTAQAYEDTIKNLVTAYTPKQVAFVAISPNDAQSIRLDEMGFTDLGDSFDEMKIRAKDKNFNFPYLYDGATSNVSMLYGPQATPHVFIFDQQRKLRYTGRVDNGLGIPGAANTFDTKNALDELLANQPVNVEKTKTLGCSIKWPSKHDLVAAEAASWKTEKVALQNLTIDSLKALLANNTANYRLVNVWATWCGPCVTEFPDFVTMNRMYRHRNFETISISMDELGRTPAVTSFLEQKQASFKNYIAVGDKYQIIDAINKDWQGALPYTALIAPGGKVIYSTQGAIDPFEMKKLIVDSLGRVFEIPEKYRAQFLK